MITTPNMSLTAWTSVSDAYNHTQLATNWGLVDTHDHSAGKGVQLNAANSIQAGTITAALFSGAIDWTTAIGTGTITGSNIASDTITASNIANATITGSKIAANTIEGSNIDPATTITVAGVTVTGTGTALLVDYNATIQGNLVVDGSISGSYTPGAGSITGSMIASGTITASNIASGTVTGSNIASGTIGGSNIASATIEGSNIDTTTSITAANLTANSSGTVGTLTVTTGNIYGGTGNNLTLTSVGVSPSNIQVTPTDGIQLNPNYEGVTISAYGLDCQGGLGVDSGLINAGSSMIGFFGQTPTTQYNTIQATTYTNGWVGNGGTGDESDTDAWANSITSRLNDVLSLLTGYGLLNHIS